MKSAYGNYIGILKNVSKIKNLEVLDELKNQED
jgi:hypothetical protein